MSPRRLSSYVLSISAAALLTACGNPQPSILQPGGNAQDNMRSQVSANGQNLLYVADADGNVEILSYPAGKTVSSIYYGLYSFLGGECADRSGNVWITNYGVIDEYPHGGTTPIWRKSAPWYLTGCSVAAKTNDVAAVGQRGTVSIWRNGRGKSKTYHTKSFYTLRYCGYDPDGDLFVDGFEPYNSHKFIFFELPIGGRKLITVSLDRKIGGAGQVQWDGRYITIQDTEAPYNIYQVKVSGGVGTVVNTIAFDGLRKPVTASWIAGSAVFVPYSAGGKFANAIGVFNYPRGGEPIGTIREKRARYIVGVTLSR